MGGGKKGIGQSVEDSYQFVADHNFLLAGKVVGVRINQLNRGCSFHLTFIFMDRVCPCSQFHPQQRVLGATRRCCDVCSLNRLGGSRSELNSSLLFTSSYSTLLYSSTPLHSTPLLSSPLRFSYIPSLFPLPILTSKSSSNPQTLKVLILHLPDCYSLGRRRKREPFPTVCSPSPGASSYQLRSQ